MEHDFVGTHIIADVYGVSEELFKEIDGIVRIVEDGIVVSGATLINTFCHEFDNGGFTLVSLLKESHVSIHSYPEKQSLFIDVFTCGNIKPNAIIDKILEYFNPQEKNVQEIQRGTINIFF